MERIFFLTFSVHDGMTSFLSGRAKSVKLLILVLAHTSLLGIFFPDFRREFGSMAGNLLVFILFLSPVAGITGMPFLRLIMGFRRELGILMGYLVIVHGLGYFLDPSFFGTLLRPYLGKNLLGMDPVLLFGIAGIGFTAPLLLTSNAFSIRVLGGKSWKRLHGLAYPLFVAVTLHRFFPDSRDGNMFLVGMIPVVLLIGGYAVLKYADRKKESLAPARKPIGYIGERYREFRSRISRPD